MLKRLCLLLLLAVPTAAQISRVTGTLEGTVIDTTGAVLPDTRIILRNSDSGQTRELASDTQGHFLAPELPVGIYAVRAAHSGFADYQHAGIIIPVGQTVRLAITLQAATVEHHVTVTDQPPAIDTSQATITTNVETERIEELPVQSRNYLNFVLLAPGVTQSDMQRQPSSSQPPLADSGFNFGGLRGRSNTVAIDGLDNNDEFTGSSRTELSLEIVREFQVVNNGLSAESGGASGGAINVVTKSGTNLIHGDAFLFGQNAVFNARDPLEEPALGTPDFNRYRAGFAIGGPIHRDRTFYYTAVEQEHTRGEASSDLDPAVAALINSALPDRITTGFFPVSRAETEVSGKLTHQLSDRHSLMLRYSFTNNRDVGDAFNTSALSDFSARGSSFTRDHALVGSLASVFTSTVVNDARFQLATRRVTLRTTDQTGPAFDIAGLASFGRPYAGNGPRRENHYEFSDTVSWSRGSHLLKTGATVNRVGLRSSMLDGFGGQYVFASLADFSAGKPSMWRQAFGNPTTDLPITAYGAFLQDHWNPSWAKHLVFNLGLRYDFERLPGMFNQDTNNFSPRLGVAYSLSDRVVVRAGYGIYFDRYLLAFLNPALHRNGNSSFEQVAQQQTAEAIFAANPTFLTAAPVIGLAPSIYRPDPALATPYSQQASLGIEYLLGKNTKLSGTYMVVRGVKLPRTVNLNLAPPVLLTEANAAALGVPNPLPQQLGRLVFGPARLDPRYDAIYQLQDRSSSTYNGASLALNRRLANEIAFSGSYTLSKTIDDASDFYEQPQNPYDLRAERALSRNDQRHRLVFSGLFDLPIGEEEDRRPGERPSTIESVFAHMEFAPILTLASGRPSDPLVGFDANHNQAFPPSSRPLGLARNSLRTPREANFDLRLVKYFNVKPHGKLDFVAEVFNVFNHRNVAAINPVFGPALTPALYFRQPIETQRPRQLQFSIDFEF